MTWPRIEPQSPKPMAKTLPVWPMDQSEVKCLCKLNVSAKKKQQLNVQISYLQEEPFKSEITVCYFCVVVKIVNFPHKEKVGDM